MEWMEQVDPRDICDIEFKQKLNRIWYLMSKERLLRKGTFTGIQSRKNNYGQVDATSKYVLICKLDILPLQYAIRFNNPGKREQIALESKEEIKVSQK